MSKKITEIEKLVKDGEVSKEVMLELISTLKDMEEEVSNLNKRCEDLEEEIEAINEDINLINDGMHIEEYDTVFSAVCPYCEKEIEINLEDIEDTEEFTCPHCKKEITLDWDGECDCGCGQDHECDDNCDCSGDEE